MSRTQSIEQDGYAWGPHQRVSSPDPSLADYNDIEDVGDAHLMAGVWTVFPHVMFGRDEGGGQRFHGRVEKILETDDRALPSLFRNGKA